ncbi:Ig-like domain-containing protein [Comamonas odontotermitis]|uniref:Ig-like domain-containing protein n=1 Tax=Comamonas odontotermitis TaxID=379895 RepID=UPI0036705805
MKLLTRTLAGVIAGLVITAGLTATAFAITSTGSITPTSGPDSGATATTITIPELTAAGTAVQTAGNYTLGSDGAVYYGYNPGTKISPAGVSFTSIESWTTTFDEVIAITADGIPYHAGNGGALTQVPLPAGVTAKQASGNYILGSDGNIYWSNGTKLAGPAGMTYTWVSGHVFGNPNWFAAVNAIGSDGNVYVATNAGTLTVVTMAASALPAMQTAGNYTIGADGAVYYSGTKMSSPAGVSFTLIESWTTDYDEVIAITAAGTAYHAVNGGALTQITLPAGVTAKQASGNYILGSDGNIYWTDGTPVANPTGMKYTSIGFHLYGKWTAEVHAIGTDGNVYVANRGTVNSSLSKQNITMTATTLTVTGVSFGMTTATSYTQTSSTTINATTPAHAAGTVDVTVTTQTSSGSVGPTYTLTQAYTFLDMVPPAAPAVNPSNGQSVSGTAEPGSTVTVKNSAGTVIGTTTAGTDGKYTVALSPAQPNGATLSVTATDAAGNTSAPTSVTVDATAPAAPAVNPSNGQSVSGTAEPGSTVTVKNSAGTVIGTTTAGTDGKYTVALSPAQPNGATLSVTATDAAGNTSAPTSVTVDAPTTPTAVPAMGYSGLVMLGMLAGLIGLLGLRRTLM